MRGKDNIDDFVERGSWASRAYAGEWDPATVYLSTAGKEVGARFEGWPRAYVTVGGNEVLLDDAKRLRERMAAAGADVTYEEVGALLCRCMMMRRGG